MPDVNGYLETLSGNRKPDGKMGMFGLRRWTRRFYVLREGSTSLSLYKSREDASSVTTDGVSKAPLEIIPLQGATVSEFIMWNKKPERHADSMFMLTDNHRGHVTYFRAGYHDARTAWLTAIEDAITCLIGNESNSSVWAADEASMHTRRGITTSRRSLSSSARGSLSAASRSSLSRRSRGSSLVRHRDYPAVRE